MISLGIQKDIARQSQRRLLHDKLSIILRQAEQYIARRRKLGPSISVFEGMSYLVANVWADQETEIDQLPQAAIRIRSGDL